MAKRQLTLFAVPVKTRKRYKYTMPHPYEEMNIVVGGLESAFNAMTEFYFPNDPNPPLLKDFKKEMEANHEYVINLGNSVTRS